MGAKFTYLLIEDDLDHAELIRRTLVRQRSEIVVEHVSDGAQALAYLRQQGPYKGRPMPDVILLDLKLPKMDGHEVLAGIKQDEQLRQIPVVVLTTSDAASDRARAYRLHANSYLVKPLDFDQFQQMISVMQQYWGIWNSG
jgi:hypothetical protein